MGGLNRVILHVRRILGKHATLNNKIYTKQNRNNLKWIASMPFLVTICCCSCVKIGCFKLLFHHDPVMFTSYAGQVCDSSKPVG